MMSYRSTIADEREYKYTVKKDDTLADIRDGLIEQINADEQVSASAAGVFTRIVLKAKIPGPKARGSSTAARQQIA